MKRDRSLRGPIRLEWGSARSRVGSGGNTMDRCGEGHPKNQSAGQGSLLKAQGARELFGEKFTKQRCGSISPETIWKGTREEGRAAGGRGSVIDGPRMRVQEPGTSIRNDGMDTRTRRTRQPVGGAHPPTAASQEGFCLFGWLTWFGKEVPFYNCQRFPSVISYPVRCINIF